MQEGDLVWCQEKKGPRLKGVIKDKQVLVVYRVRVELPDGLRRGRFYLDDKLTPRDPEEETT